MSETKTYRGSCHCGAVSYDVTMAPPEKAFACNCSICRRTGALLAFVPNEAFKLVTGETAMTDYQFGKKSIHHQFCTTCGVRAFAHGTDGTKAMVAINMRCLAGLDAANLPVEMFDGASI
jgi:hypothetical protein